MANFTGSYLGRFPLVSAEFSTSDRLSERSRSVNGFSPWQRCIALVLPRRLIDARTAYALEAARTTGAAALALLAPFDRDFAPYDYDLAAMTQRNRETGRVREIRRFDVGDPGFPS